VPSPHPPRLVTQRLASSGITCRLIKLSLVGNLSQRNRRANIDTFRGICLCQTKYDISAVFRASNIVRMLRTTNKLITIGDIPPHPSVNNIRLQNKVSKDTSKFPHQMKRILALYLFIHFFNMYNKLLIVKLKE
jgi:hypothetical protein